MILAAGLGTRLRPLTNDRPKALATIASRTLLEIAIARLRCCGVSEIIVNAHHFADQIADYLEAHRNFGMRIEVSREEVLLDTGGGLKKAAWFFLGSSAARAQAVDAPFLMHNVDVFSAIDLSAMVRYHKEHNALATIAVQDREASRYLLFDAEHRLCGPRGGSLPRAEALKAIETGLVRPAPGAEARQIQARPVQARPVQTRQIEARPIQALAFCGIHVLSPRIFSMMQEEGAFSIVNLYLRLAAEGERILGFRADGAYWRDLGRPEDLTAATRDLESRIYPPG
jgi:NDP-sugar pyrophosphorylase family protein